MKITIEYWYPVTSEIRDTKEIEVPDNVDVESWLYDNTEAIIEKESGERLHVNAYDLGYAGVKQVKEERS
jgi:hypothetical protein